MGAYSEHRRVEPVRRLAPVTKNEAMESGDVVRERLLERQWEAQVDRARRDAAKRRPFSDRLPP